MSAAISDIQDKFSKSEYRFTDHAVKRMIQRSVERIEVEEAIMHGEIIEEYPDDKYSPSCLIYGRTLNGRDLHIQISFPPRVFIVTLYEPNLEEWIDQRTRRK